MRDNGLYRGISMFSCRENNSLPPAPVFSVSRLLDLFVSLILNAVRIEEGVNSRGNKGI